MFWLLQAGQRARYRCIAGYRLEGEDNNADRARITCVGDGLGIDGWDQARPNCERMYKYYI